MKRDEDESAGGGVGLVYPEKAMRMPLDALVLVLLLGCTSCTPAPNQPPTAQIAFVAPVEATEGEAIASVGYGTDTDGDVVGYLWQSDRDGELSRLPEFETKGLSVGQHRISFVVQDNNAALSEEVQCSVTVRTVPVAVPAEVRSFLASASTIGEGESATLSWDVANASTIVIDQAIGTVFGVGSMTVTPEDTITYTLIASGGGATATAKVTITVQPPPEPLPPFWIEEMTAECDASSDCAISPPVLDQDWKRTERSVYVCSPLRIACEMGGVADDFTFEWSADVGKLKGNGHSIIWVAPGYACKARVTVTVRNASGVEDTATIGFRVSTVSNAFKWPEGHEPDPWPSC